MTTDTDRDIDTDGPPTLRVRGPADLVQAIPFLLGFHPLNSLVLVGLAGGRVGVTARIDLPDLALCEVLANSVRGMRRGGATQFVGAVFDDDAMPDTARRRASDPLPWAGVAAELTEAVEELGGTVDDVVLVSRSRLWSYVCAEPDCCPPEGTPIAPNSTVAATATYAGLVALPDRESVGQLLEPLPDIDRDRLVSLLESAEEESVGAILRGEIDRESRSVKRALFAACRAGDVPGAEPALSDAQVVRFAVALQRYEIRDAVWLAIDDGRIDGRPLWRFLARRLPSPFDAAPLFLFAWCSYRDGNGALAGMAARRALDSDPGYGAADLVLAALSHAVDPRRMPKLRSRRSA